MKKIILILLYLVLVLCGCVYQAELRPEYNDTDVWVCESPYIELYWSSTIGNAGKITINKIEENIYHESNYGPLIKIYTSEAKNTNDIQEQKEFSVFKGHVNYGEDRLTIEVQEDYKNIFNGEKPTLEFKRYDKQEYLKNKEK
ncbi:MAG: hypothetical protein IKA17_02405 [Clostridia bacterium]|nr:hypothetical protein [Clostridia bacterium]